MKNHVKINFPANPRLKPISIFDDFDIWYQGNGMIITNNRTKEQFHYSDVRIKEMRTTNSFDMMHCTGYYRTNKNLYYPVHIRINIDIHSKK